jgi:hypothetical protein
VIVTHLTSAKDLLRTRPWKHPKLEKKGLFLTSQDLKKSVLHEQMHQRVQETRIMEGGIKATVPENSAADVMSVRLHNVQYLRGALDIAFSALS